MVSNFIFDPTRWYQIVFVYNGGDTSSPLSALEASNVYITDLTTGVTIEGGIVGFLSFDSAFTVSDISISFDEFDTTTNMAIADVLDGILDQTDAVNLANYSEINPVEYSLQGTSGGGTIFTGWAMGNVVGKTFPFVHDYVFFVENDNIINADTIFRLDMNELFATAFDGEAPPITT